MTSQLIAETFSPWSEKARFALDHHRVPYRFHEYVPMMQEPWLRLRVKTLRGRVSVPAFISDAGTFRDSFAIAREAERIGEGAPLFPAGRDDEITAWNERSERALAAARARVIVRMTEVPGADIEALPPFLPRPLRPLLRGAANMGVRYLRGKYRLASDVDASTRAVRAELEALRDALQGRPYLLGALSYADLTMAVVLQPVSPVDDAFIPLGPATRDVWSNRELASAFKDLVEWRDALYAKHRHP